LEVEGTVTVWPELSHLSLIIDRYTRPGKMLTKARSGVSGGESCNGQKPKEGAYDKSGMLIVRRCRR
jgi:hypothetical protein